MASSLKHRMKNKPGMCVQVAMSAPGTSRVGGTIPSALSPKMKKSDLLQISGGA